MPSMTLLKAVPDQIANEGAIFQSLDLKQFIQLADARSQIRFQAGLKDGRPLPQGLICTDAGLISGMAAKGTEGTYVVSVKVEDLEGEKLTLDFNLAIKPVNVAQQSSQLRELKSKVWDAVGKGQPLPQMPELKDLLTWPVTPFDVYYLLERFAYLTVWDAYNLDAPGKLKPLQLLGASARYNVWDRGSCIVAAPKDLHDPLRTPYDALVTARAVANEVYKRGWTIEFSGFDKMVRAAWVRLQVLGTQQGKTLDILNYVPPAEDAVIYNKEISAVKAEKPGPG